jgi:hypothetical protein
MLRDRLRFLLPSDLPERRARKKRAGELGHPWKQLMGLIGFMEHGF